MFPLKGNRFFHPVANTVDVHSPFIRYETLLPPPPPKEKNEKKKWLATVSGQFLWLCLLKWYTITYTYTLFDFTIYTSNSMCRDITSAVHTHLPYFFFKWVRLLSSLLLDCNVLGRSATAFINIFMIIVIHMHIQFHILDPRPHVVIVWY